MPSISRRTMIKAAVSDGQLLRTEGAEGRREGQQRQPPGLTTARVTVLTPTSGSGHRIHPDAMRRDRTGCSNRNFGTASTHTRVSSALTRHDRDELRCAEPLRSSATQSADASPAADMHNRVEEIRLSYIHCPNCGLSVHLRAPFLTFDRCPRCLARRGAVVSMVVTEHRSWPAPTDDAASSKSGTEDVPDEGDCDARAPGR